MHLGLHPARKGQAGLCPTPAISSFWELFYIGAKKKNNPSRPGRDRYALKCFEEWNPLSSFGSPNKTNERKLFLWNRAGMPRTRWASGTERIDGKNPWLEGSFFAINKKRAPLPGLKVFWNVL